MKMEKTVAFDFETIANQAMMDFLPEVKPKANLKDPAKIEIDIAYKKEKQVADMGLTPMLNMICCAGWYDDKGNSGGIVLDDESPESEKRLIDEFWDIMSDYDHFVTFNGRAFDMRCLLQHGTKLGIIPSIVIDSGRFDRGNHTDLRHVFFGSETFAKGKLDLVSNYFLGHGKTKGIDGAEVQHYWDIGLVVDIKKYCVEDARITMALYKKALNGGLID